MSECQNAIKWFSENKMIVALTSLNPLLFKEAITQANLKQFLIRNDVVKVALSVKLLGINIDDQLHFNLRISSICKSASKQLNALDSL